MPDIAVYLLELPAEFYSPCPCLIAWCQTLQEPSAEERERAGYWTDHCTAVFLYRDRLQWLIITQAHLEWILKAEPLERLSLIHI